MHPTGPAVQLTGATPEIQPTKIHHTGLYWIKDALLVIFTVKLVLSEIEKLCLVLLFVLQELWAKSFLHHDNRHSCFHWPGAVLTLVVVVGLLCCHGSQPEGRWAGLDSKKTFDWHFQWTLSNRWV